MVMMVPRLNSVSELIIAKKSTGCKNKRPYDIQIGEITYHSACEIKADVGHCGNHQTGGRNVLPDVKIPELVSIVLFHSLIQFENKGMRKSEFDSRFINQVN